MAGEIIIGVLALLGTWGSIWYKLGKLTTTVESHGTWIKRVERKVNKVLKNSNKGGE